MRTTRRTCLIVTLLAGLAACDRTPTDPGLEEAASSAASSAVFASSPTSLSQLFRRAAGEARQRGGARAAELLFLNWRRLNDEARSALRSGDREAAQVKIEAVRREELALVVRVLGPKAITSVVQDVAVALARARLELSNASAAGKDIVRAGSHVRQAAGLLEAANRALVAGDYTTALDQATRASELVDGVSHYLITLRRIGGLEILFADAVARAGRDRHSATLTGLLAAHEKWNADARASLRQGDREQARQKLEAARVEQIRVVLHVFGPGVVLSLIDQVDANITATRKRLRLADPAAAPRAARMLVEAASLNARATNANARRDVATALDLASHAAGLVNAIQHLLPR